MKAMVQWLTFLNVNNILLNVLLFRTKHHTEDIYYIGNIGTRVNFLSNTFLPVPENQSNERNAVFGTEIYMKCLKNKI